MTRRPILIVYGYVYLTTNSVNNRKYIGQHTHNKPELDTRYLGSGKILQQALDLYGRDKFTTEILEWAESKEELDRLEKSYIERFDAVNSDEFYNILAGGSSLGSGPNHPSYGKPHNGDTSGCNNPMYGKHHSEESKQLIRQNRNPVKLSPKHKQKLIRANIGNKKRAKTTYQYTVEGVFVNEYLSASDTKNYGFNETCVMYCCQGVQKQHKGFLWSYIPPDEYGYLRKVK